MGNKDLTDLLIVCLLNDYQRPGRMEDHIVKMDDWLIEMFCDEPEKWMPLFRCKATSAIGLLVKRDKILEKEIASWIHEDPHHPDRYHDLCVHYQLCAEDVYG